MSKPIYKLTRLPVLLNSVGFYLKEQERYEEAVELYKESLEACENLSLELLNQATREKLLEGLLDQQELEEIQQMLGDDFSELSPQQMIAFLLQQPFVQQPLKEKLSIHFPPTTTIMNNLAEVYNAVGRHNDAEKIYLQVIEIDRERLGDDHPDVATALNNLALVYQSQEQYSDAEPLFLKALQIREQRLGSSHPDVAQSSQNLALLYKTQERYVEAEKLYKRALKIWQTQLGDHPDVALVLNNLGELYKTQKLYSQAEPYLKEAVEVRRRLFQEAPEMHQRSGVIPLALARSLKRLADLYQLQERLQDAEPLYRESLEIQEEKLVKSRPSVAHASNNLAEIYRKQKRCYDEAERLYKQALNTWRLEDNYFYSATILNNLGLLAELQERDDEAELFYEEVLQILFTKLGGNHPDSKTFYHNNFCFLQRMFQTGRTAELTTPIMQQILQRNLAVWTRNNSVSD